MAEEVSPVRYHPSLLKGDIDLPATVHEDLSTKPACQQSYADEWKWIGVPQPWIELHRKFHFQMQHAVDHVGEQYGLAVTAGRLDQHVAGLIATGVSVQEGKLCLAAYETGTAERHERRAQGSARRGPGGLHAARH